MASFVGAWALSFVRFISHVKGEKFWSLGLTVCQVHLCGGREVSGYSASEMGTPVWMFLCLAQIVKS